MLKKFLVFLTILIITPTYAYAKSAKAMTYGDISTGSPNSWYSFQLIEDLELTENFCIKEGSLITGHLSDIKKPKVGKRDAYIVIKPVQYTFENKIYDLSPYKIKLKVETYKPIKAKDVATFAASNTVGMLLPGVNESYSFYKGFRNAEEYDNKIKAGIMQVYKDSPFSYIEKGNELNTHQGEIVILKLKD